MSNNTIRHVNYILGIKRSEILSLYARLYARFYASWKEYDEHHKLWGLPILFLSKIHSTELLLNDQYMSRRVNW